MLRDINQEIEKLLEIKKEVEKIVELRKSNSNIIILSQARYDFFKSQDLLIQDKYYYIAPIEVRPYIEDFQG